MLPGISIHALEPALCCKASMPGIMSCSIVVPPMPESTPSVAAVVVSCKQLRVSWSRTPLVSLLCPTLGPVVLKLNKGVNIRCYDAGEG